MLGCNSVFVELHCNDRYRAFCSPKSLHPGNGCRPALQLPIHNYTLRHCIDTIHSFVSVMAAFWSACQPRWWARPPLQLPRVPTSWVRPPSLTVSTNRPQWRPLRLSCPSQRSPRAVGRRRRRRPAPSPTRPAPATPTRARRTCWKTCRHPTLPSRTRSRQRMAAGRRISTGW